MVTRRREFIARTYGDPLRANNQRNMEDSPTHPPTHPFVYGFDTMDKTVEFKIQEPGITICLITVAYYSQTKPLQTKLLP